METQNAIAAFAALSQGHRLEVFRLLVRQAPYGLPAGQIADCLGIHASTLSSYLAQLEGAGLIRSWRDQRRIFYASNSKGIQSLLAFFTGECCDGHPELCDDQPRGERLVMRADAAWNARSEAVHEKQIFNVLFLCTNNSARSIMAECIMNRLGKGRFQAHSAGSHPSGTVHPSVIKLLRKYHYPTEQLRSKSWHEFSGPDTLPLDFVFTLCDGTAKDTCPEWPGRPMSTHWGLPDPAAVEGTKAEKAFAFVDTMRMLTHRIDIFVNFPLDTLPRMSLQKRLDAIGKTTPQAAQL